jgi:DNA repair protein RadA/Sms
VYAAAVAKTRQIFVCRSCGSAQSRWVGKCPDCGEWDTLEEERSEPGSKRDPQKGLVEAWATLREGEGGTALAGAEVARPLAEVDEGEGAERISTGIGELDRVLGGEGASRGLVPGSAVLIGGSPGIGKSTLLLQAASSLAARGQRVLYVSSEESARQIRGRAERLKGFGQPGKAAPLQSGQPADAGPPAGLFVLADTNLARIVEQTRKVVPAVLIIDSVQMIYKSDLPAAPGSITQLRRCCSELVYLAKLSGIAVVLVGHVTKDGQLAGPRLLEHLVDAVFSFEGDRYHAHRLVRGVKNRFGTTQEIGIFEMTGEGLREVPEGAGVAAVTIGNARPTPGSVVCPIVTGTRCVLVEVQALTATGFLGAAKRKSSGLDANRLAMIIAVLEQHMEMRLADRDIFASAVGGVRVVEPASDLALLLAIAGAQLRRALAPATAVVGEVGLGGEVRPVTQLEQRVREAARLGYKRVIVPTGGSSRIADVAGGVEVVRVRTVGEAVGELG